MLYMPELTVKLVDAIMAAPVFPAFRIRYDSRKPPSPKSTVAG